MTTTPLPLSIGDGGGEALTVAKGIATIGVGEAGAGVAWGKDRAGMAWVEGGTGAVWVAGEVGHVEAPAAAAMSSRIDRTSINLARFYAFSTMPTPKKEEIRTK